MQKILNALIEIQEIDLKLDHLRNERGDLPSIVGNLKNLINSKKEILNEQKEKINSLKKEDKSIDLELNSLREKLKKYENQLYQVKTNKEYDAISNETENVKKKISELENVFLEKTELREKLINSNEEIVKELVTLQNEFEENNAELIEKISVSSEEENLLQQEREIVKKNLSIKQLNTYERIRDAKKGVAVAYANGGVCSGCFSFIPPQKAVEIKNMKNLFYCESCGRILVWDRNEE